MNKPTKDHRITFRLSPAEYCRLAADAASCGQDLSGYIRLRVTKNVTRLFYDPEMTAELRAYRKIIRELVREVEQIRRRVDQSNVVQLEELTATHSLIRAIYNQLECLKKSLDSVKEEVISNGDRQTA